MLKRNLLILTLIAFIIVGCGVPENDYYNDYYENESSANVPADLSPAADSAEACSAVSEAMIAEVKALCAAAGSDEICYGHEGIDVTPRAGVDAFAFDTAGDIADLASVQSIKLSPEEGFSGVALIRLQTQLSDAESDQNATFILFGDVELTIDAEALADGSTHYSFQLREGSNQTDCASALPDGLLVQTPKGKGSTSFKLNGAEISLGSTVFFTVNDDRQLSVAPIEGSARVTSGGASSTAIAGTQVQVPLNEDAQATEAPTQAESYAKNEDIENIPVDFLEDEIEISEPLSDEDVMLFNEYDELFDGVDVEDADELFDYLDDNEAPDIVGYLINELDYEDFDDDVELYLEEDLGYDLEEYDDYIGGEDCDPDVEDCDSTGEDGDAGEDDDSDADNDADEDDDSDADNDSDEDDDEYDEDDSDVDDGEYDEDESEED